MTCGPPRLSLLAVDHDGTPPDPLLEATAQRVSDAPAEVPDVEAATARAVARTDRPAADGAAAWRAAERQRHLAVHTNADRGALPVVPSAPDHSHDPVVRSHDAYFFFSVCDRALPAAVFAALGDFGFDMTLLAAEAAFAPVCLVFLPAM